jgi:hypothetical protein
VNADLNTKPSVCVIAPGEAEFRFSLITGLLRHKEAVTAVLIGRQLGLNVTHEHNGGRLDRFHLITARGDAGAIRRCVEIYNGWVRLFRTEVSG